MIKDNVLHFMPDGVHQRGGYEILGRACGGGFDTDSAVEGRKKGTDSQ